MPFFVAASEQHYAHLVLDAWFNQSPLSNNTDEANKSSVPVPKRPEGVLATVHARTHAVCIIMVVHNNIINNHVPLDGKMALIYQSNNSVVIFCLLFAFSVFYYDGYSRL